MNMLMPLTQLRIFGRIILLASFCLWFSATFADARDLPDLVISGTQLAATGDCSGKTALISGKVYIKNTGQGRGQIFTTREMIRSFVKDQPNIKGADRFVNSMRPGETVAVDIQLSRLDQFGKGLPTRISGTYDVVLEVDPRGVFKEENESNNHIIVQVKLFCA